MVGELPKTAAYLESLLGDKKASMESSWQLPPEGHRFPWSLTDHSLTTISISGGGGSEYLYLVVKRKQANCICFPNSGGNEYKNHRLAEFEMMFEIGSETETFTTTKVCVVFKVAFNNIELVKWNVID